MHPLESKTQAPQANAQKPDPAAPQRLRLQGLLGPLVGFVSGYRPQIEAQQKDLGLTAEQSADLDALLESLRKLEQHAKRLLP